MHHIMSDEKRSDPRVRISSDSLENQIMRRVVAIVSVIGLVAVAAAGQIFDKSRAADTTPVNGLDLSRQIYPDGVYIGESTGYRPGFLVEVTVRNGRVAEVRVIDHNEVRIRYWRRAIQVIPREIVKRQSTALDALSGATATSNGVLAAVENALGYDPPKDE
jgi:uncharacterized protein with FMN-binding domain